MHFGHAAIVPGDEAMENLGEEAALLHAEAAHDAEIDGDDAALVIDEQIAGMQIGVEKPVAHGVQQEALHQRGAERLSVEAGGNQSVAVGNRNAVDPFQRQHAARASASSRPWARGSLRQS